MKLIPHAACTALLGVAVCVVPSCSLNVNSLEGYGFDFRGPTATRTQQGDILGHVKTVEVNNRFGKVHVEPVEDSFGWRWELTCWSDAVEQAERFASQIQLNVQQRGDVQTWIVTLPQPPVPQLRGVRSDLTLQVPASVQVVVSNGFGDTTIQGVEGSVVTETRHGQVELADLAGSVNATHSFGQLQASRIHRAHLVNSHGQVNVREAAGDLIIHNQFGEVTATDVLGQLEIVNAHGQVSVGNVGGRAEIRGAFAPIQLSGAQSDVLLHNKHGQVTVRQVRGRLEIENAFGGIDADVESAEVICKCKHGSILLRLRNPQLRLVQAETAFANLDLQIPERLSPAIQSDVKFGQVHSDVPVRLVESVDSERGLSSEAPRIIVKNQHGDIHIKQSPGDA